MSSLSAANSVDAAALADELARFRVIDPSRATDLLSEFRGGDAAALVEQLVRRGVLTSYQAERALAGECRLLALGPYRVTGQAGFCALGPLHTAVRHDKPDEFLLRIFPLRSLWRARQAKQIARSLSAVTQPSVVPLLDVDSANGFHYLVWPRVKGQNLSERVASGPISSSEAIALLAHLAATLHACHERNIIHGALNPLSIVFDLQGLPRLVDLGIGAILAANLAEEESLLDTISASIAATTLLKFSAPEFVASARGTPETDQYALGAIGYFALTGEPPFATASLSDWLAAKTSGKPYPLAEVTASISAELAAIIDTMLQANPAERFSGLDEVASRLAVLAGASTPAAEELEETEPPADEEQPFAIEPSKPSGTTFWTPGPRRSELPPRDDTDGSITFELPPPEPDDIAPVPISRSERVLPPEPMAAVRVLPPEPMAAVRGVDTPNRSFNETEAHPSLEAGPTPSDHPLLKGYQLGAISPPRMSPPPEDLHMAKPQWPDPFEREEAARAPQTRTPADPRKGVGTPVHYHTENADPGAMGGSPSATTERPLTDSFLWKKVKRNLLFWQTPLDVLQVSVFGPLSVAPGHPTKVSVFVHTPETTDSVKTLSRAFHHDSELIGTGYVAQEVARETELGVHLTVANAGVSKSLLSLTWRGQPHRLVFDLHVPWESPGGRAPGLVSIGRDNVRIGKIEFWLTLLPRKG